MALKTDYLDFIPPAGGRVYQLTTVDAVTQKYNIADVTEYTQNGDAFGAVDINAANTKVNDIITGLSVQLGVPFLTGGIDKDTNKPIWGLVQDHTFASIAAGYNTAFAITGVTKFVHPVQCARKYGPNLVSGPLPVDTLASFVAPQGIVTRQAVELLLFGTAVTVSTDWRFWAYYTL